MVTYILIMLMIIVVVYKTKAIQNSLVEYKVNKDIFLKRNITTGIVGILLMILSIVLFICKISLLCLLTVCLSLILHSIEDRYKEEYKNNTITNSN